MGRLRDYQWNDWVLKFADTCEDRGKLRVIAAIRPPLWERTFHLHRRITRAEFTAFCALYCMPGDMGAADRLFDLLQHAKNAATRDAAVKRAHLKAERAAARAARARRAA